MEDHRVLGDRNTNRSGGPLFLFNAGKLLHCSLTVHMLQLVQSCLFVLASLMNRFTFVRV